MKKQFFDSIAEKTGTCEGKKTRSEKRAVIYENLWADQYANLRHYCESCTKGYKPCPHRIKFIRQRDYCTEVPEEFYRDASGEIRCTIYRKSRRKTPEELFSNRQRRIKEKLEFRGQMTFPSL